MEPNRNRLASPQATRSDPNADRVLRTADSRCWIAAAGSESPSGVVAGDPGSPGGGKGLTNGCRVAVPELLEEHASAASRRDRVVPSLEHVRTGLRIVRYRSRSTHGPNQMRLHTVGQEHTRRVFQPDDISDRESRLPVEHLERQLRPKSERAAFEVRTESGSCRSGRAATRTAAGCSRSGCSRQADSTVAGGR